MMMLRVAVVLAVANGACLDDPNFVAANGLRCTAWAGVDCLTHSAGLRSSDLADVLRNCPQTCNTCIPASDYCDTGIGGDTVKVSVNSAADLAKFDFFEDPLLSTSCEWHAPNSGVEGIQQTSNAWGNPGDNSLMGCLAIIKGANYKDLIMSVAFPKIIIIWTSYFFFF